MHSGRFVTGSMRHRPSTYTTIIFASRVDAERILLAELVAELHKRQIPLELNPSSNVRTGVCASLAEHPLRRYFDGGLMVTLNSDDPAFFGSTVENEYRLAHEVHGFDREELKTLAANSFRASFLPEAEKQQWLSRIESVI